MKRFWDFSPADKRDQLDENNPRHAQWVVEALADTETGVERLDKDTYTVYGEEEALLVRPRSLVVRVCLDLLIGLQHVRSNTQKDE